MNQTHYLIDNNALITLGRQRRATKHFRTHCRIPTDVLHEAQGFNDPNLAPLEYKTTPNVLRHVAAIMATVPTGDTTLIDLYKNKGAADPLLLACALDARDEEQNWLIPNTWAIVTYDKAVLTLANTLNINTTSPDALATLIDSSK